MEHWSDSVPEFDWEMAARNERTRREMAEAEASSYREALEDMKMYVFSDETSRDEIVIIFREMVRQALRDGRRFHHG